MSQDPRAVALAQEICSGLGVGNLTDIGMAILVRHIEDALTDARRQALEKVAARIIDTHRMGDRDEWLDLARLIRAQASQEAP